MASMDSDAVLFGENLKKFLDNASNTFEGYLGCTVNISSTLSLQLLLFHL